MRTEEIKLFQTLEAKNLFEIQYIPEYLSAILFSPSSHLEIESRCLITLEQQPAATDEREP